MHAPNHLAEPLLAAGHLDHHERFDTLFRKGTANGADGEAIPYAFDEPITCPVGELRRFLRMPTAEDGHSRSELKYRQRRFNEMSKMHTSKHLHPVPFSSRSFLKKLLFAILFVVLFMAATWHKMSAVAAVAHGAPAAAAAHGEPAAGGEAHGSSASGSASASGHGSSAGDAAAEEAHGSAGAGAAHAAAAGGHHDTSFTDGQATIVVVVFLIAMTLFFEWAKDYAEETVPREMRPVLSQIFSEFTVLGFMAMVTYFMIQANVLATFSNAIYHDPEHLVHLCAFRPPFALQATTVQATTLPPSPLHPRASPHEPPPKSLPTSPFRARLDSPPPPTRLPALSKV